MCCHSKGSPPRVGSKNAVPQRRSNSNWNNADRDDRQRERQKELHDEAHPHEHRHPEQRHAGRAHVDHGHGEVDRADGRRDTGDQQAERVERHAIAGVGRRVRRVREPAAVGAAAQEPARVQEQPAEQEHPELKRVQPRERDVARPDHQRDQVVEERGRHRHDEQEDHRQAVHREDLVVLLGVQHRVARLRQLRPDQQRLDPTDDEEQERRDAVHDPDLLVVHRGEPAPEARRRHRATKDPLLRRHGDGCHRSVRAPRTGYRGRPSGTGSAARSGCSPASSRPA